LLVGGVVGAGPGVDVADGAGAGAGVAAAGAEVAAPAAAGAAATGCPPRDSRRARSRAIKPASANWVNSRTAAAAIRKYFFIMILLEKC